MKDRDLLLFGTSDKPDVQIAWDLYQSGLMVNQDFKLDKIVETNENFYVGKQWEGVVSNGLPTPVYNFIKRVVGFIVSSITSDRITVLASQMAAAGIRDKEYADRIVAVVNAEFQSLCERNNIPKLAQKIARNAAVDGDGCLYSYWDADVHTGMWNGDAEIMGAIKKEILDNDRVFFGNPQDNDPQAQPYIIISTREFVRDAKKRAKENGSKDWQNIQPDEDQRDMNKKPYQICNDKVTTLLLLYRDEETETIWAYESTQTGEIREPWDTGCRLYPISWMNWDFIKDSYHGEAMITGLIPNQIFVNKMWALIQVSFMRSAFGKVIYDKTRVARWDNAVGAAIGVTGNVDNVAKNIDPSPVQPQVFQLLELAVKMAEQNMGATDVAMGDSRPDNTSAIIALQRASNTPHEIPKHNLYDCIEDSFRIDLDLMTANYGQRPVLVPPTAMEADAYKFAKQPVPENVTIKFDFSQLANHPFTLKLDVGASTYWSETAAIQTMDNLLMNHHILASEYLDRLPEDFMPKKGELLAAVRAREDAQGLSAPITPNPAPAPQMAPAGEEALVPQEMAEQVEGQMDIPTGSGNGAMQRAIARTGEVPPEIL